MDRQIVYAGSIPLETDLLNTNRNTMVALGKLASSLFGSQTIVNGLAVTPTQPASLSVSVAPGELYTLANLDGSAYSSLSADTSHQVMKQGIALDSVTVALPTPATSGQSINYLIQAMYQDLDTGASVLPYYSSSNPALAWSGPANAGTPQYTQRKGTIVIKAKAGTAATTGSQVTPSPDNGFVGLYVVTVANGQSSITASNISQYTNAPILPGGLLQAIQAGRATYGMDISTTANICKVNLSPAVSSLTDGMIMMFQVANTNTGAVTLSLNGLNTAPVMGGAHQPLQGGELVAGGRAEVVWHAGLASWVVLGCTGGAVQIGAAGQSKQAVKLEQVALVVNSIADLKALQSGGAIFVTVTAYDSVNDGGGGFYRLMSSDTTGYVDNGGSIIIGKAGVWELVQTMPPTLKQFGAKGNGVSDDTVAITNAIASCAVIRATAGTYICSAQIPLGKCALIGDGSGKTVFITSYSGYLFKPTVQSLTISGIQIQGHTNIQANTVAMGIDMSSIATHNWVLRDIVFKYLNQAFMVSQGWVGELEDVSILDCGTTTQYAMVVQNASNNINCKTLKISGGNGGVGSGPSNNWAGMGLYVGPDSGTDVLDISFHTLLVEGIGVQNAVTFASPVNVYGGYFESDYTSAQNQLNISAPCNFYGGYINCVVNPVGISVNAINWFGVRAGTSLNTGNFIGCHPVDSRVVVDLTTLGFNLPQNRLGEPVNVPIAGPGNFSGIGAGGNIWGLSSYYGSSNALAVVSGGAFNTASLAFTVTGTVDWGGAIGLPYSLPSGANQLYGWAIVKCNSSDQVVLSLGGADSQNAGQSIFTSLTPNHWYLLMIGPVSSSYDGNLWVRAYGANGGAATIGTVVTIDSWGVGVGGVNFANISADFSNTGTSAKALRFRARAEAAIIAGLLATGGCSSTGATLTFQTITIDGTEYPKFAGSSSGMPSGFSAIIDPQGYFPVINVNCGNALSIGWSTSLASYNTRIYSNNSIGFSTQI